MDPSRDELIAQVCHELRAPLTPIKGYLHTLLRRDEELGPEERRHIYEVLLREEERMEDLVRDLLHATTLDHQEPATATDTVDWPTLVADQVDLYRHSDLSREITAEVATEVGTVIADAGLASSVLANLLTNALKHSPAGTPIAVRASLDGRSVVTTVSDRGPGVRAEDRDRIFDRFVQVRGSGGRAAAGVGLGLYLARRAVEAMGGELWCADAPDGGAAFSFTLPAG